MSVKRSKCPHNRVVRKRGPQKDSALVNDVDDRGDPIIRRLTGLRVWEVCLRCDRYKWIRFREVPG